MPLDVNSYMEHREPEAEPGTQCERIGPGVLRLVSMPCDFRADAEDSPRMWSAAAFAYRNAGTYQRRLPPELERMQQYIAPADVFGEAVRPDNLVLNIKHSSLAAMASFLVRLGERFPHWRDHHFPLQRGRAYVSHLWCMQRLVPEILGEMLIQTMHLGVADALWTSALMCRVSRRWRAISSSYVYWVLLSLQPCN